MAVSFPLNLGYKNMPTSGPQLALATAGKSIIIPGVGAVGLGDPRARAHIEGQGVNWDTFLSGLGSGASAGAAPGSATNAPAPGGGQGPYGAVPGTTTSVNPAALWNVVYPNLSGDLGSALGVTRSQLAGELTPEVQRSVTNAANARAVAGGVGGSPFAGSVIARDLGLTAMDLQNQGVSNLNNQIAGISQNLVQPTIDLSQSNAILRSAPNPAAAAAEQQRVYEQQQQRSFERQQTLMNNQFQQQMAYLDKYLKPATGGISSGGGSRASSPGYTTYTRYGPGVGGGALESAPYYTMKF